MKRTVLLGCLFSLASAVFAQQNDPVAMKINGKEVLLSEFEYSYNKNNVAEVADKKSLDEYIDLFVNYKLKVEAALDARYDTLSSYKKEFASYRDQQIRPYFVTEAAQEAEIRNYYDKMKESIGPDGLILPMHILIGLSQKATEEEQQTAKARVDSIYAALKQGASFEELAKKYSSDPGSARQGGLLGWICKGQTVKEFEEQAFALDKNQMSEPFLSPFGYHIVLIKDKKQVEPYEELKPQIKTFLEQRGLNDKLAMDAINKMVKDSDGKMTVDAILEKKTQELCASNSDLRYLIQEYHDGLLLYEISSREIWQKASADTAGLESYFKKHRKEYKWDEPRYRGIVYHCNEKSLVKSVKKLLKKTDISEWVDTLRAVYNQDSIQQLKAEKNLFRKGDNAFVDHLVFKVKEEPKNIEGYPYVAVYGKKLKKPATWEDVRGEVISDYQAQKEKEFVEKLRSKYKVEIYKEVINSVNKE